MTTTVARRGAAEQQWHHVDANGLIVGRLAVRLAVVLMGKHKPIYTPHVDCGDFVVVTNCEKVCFTGTKWTDKMYRHHTRYIGGLVEQSAQEVLTRHPERILRDAVKRMLPKTKLGRQMLKKLKLYVGPEHPHAAQQPKTLAIQTGRK